MNKRSKKKDSKPKPRITLAQFLASAINQSVFGDDETVKIMKVEVSSNVVSLRYDKEGRINMILFDTEPRDISAIKRRSHGK